MLNSAFTVSISRNRGDSWERHLLPDTIRGRCHALAIAPSQREVIYAAGEVEDQGAVFRSTDIGHTWTRTSAPPETVFALSISPFDACAVYAAANHLYRTTDAGATWTRVDLPPQCVNLSSVRVHPRFPDSVAAAGRWGVVKTGNGNDWCEMNEGLEEKHIAWLEWADGGNWLIAATAGHACYGWCDVTGIAGRPGLPARPSPLAVSPNPCRSSVALSSSLPGPTNLRVIDVAGRVVLSRSFASSLRPCLVDLSALPAGVYRLELDDGRSRALTQLAKL